jgi:uncharacterized membrane protein (UPF0127 family)
MTAFLRLLRRYLGIMLAIVVVGLGLVGGSLFWAAHRVSSLAYLGAMPDCAPEVVHLGGPWGVAAVDVEIADTAETRARGLMFRETLPDGTGMLFVYPEPVDAVFWMKDTPLALDILFFDARGDLRHVHFGARPFDETPIPGGSGIKAALEVRAGEVARLGIGPRTSLRHPSLDQDAARWAC